MSSQPVNNKLLFALYNMIKEETEDINKARETELKRLRKGKRGRPYQPIKHYTRAELNKMRDEKLKEYEKNDYMEELEQTKTFKLLVKKINAY